MRIESLCLASNNNLHAKKWIIKFFQAIAISEHSRWTDEPHDNGFVAIYSFDIDLPHICWLHRICDTHHRTWSSWVEYTNWLQCRKSCILMQFGMGTCKMWYQLKYHVFGVPHSIVASNQWSNNEWKWVRERERDKKRNERVTSSNLNLLQSV